MIFPLRRRKEKALKPLQFQGFSRFTLVRVTGFEPAAS
nr:MAG TPA: Rubisco accumulation factor 1 helix turn helix domain [Caudoviricetes sp.]